MHYYLQIIKQKNNVFLGILNVVLLKFLIMEVLEMMPGVQIKVVNVNLDGNTVCIYKLMVDSLHFTEIKIYYCILFST
jgi:hypothetical protein